MDKEKIKPINSKELAALYNVSVKTFRRWLVRRRNEIGKPELGYCYSIKQVQIIFDYLGTP